MTKNIRIVDGIKRKRIYQLRQRIVQIHIYMDNFERFYWEDEELQRTPKERMELLDLAWDGICEQVEEMEKLLPIE